MTRRRTVLRFLVSFFASAPVAHAVHARASSAGRDRARVAALAEAVLPRELGGEGVERAIAAFMLWVRDYRADAELDHGYGFTQLMGAPPSPMLKYPAQLDDLDRRCGGNLSAAPLAERQRAVIEALVAAGIKELPARPDGGHVATDLMAHYFQGPEANDLAYARAIGRLSCRGLAGSEQPPSALPGARGTAP